MHTEPVSDLALLLLLDPLHRAKDGVPHLVEAHALHGALMQDHLQYEVLYSPADLARFRAVVAPNLTCLSEAGAAALTEYVAEGGRLLITGSVGTSDCDSSQHPSSSLATLAGFSAQRWAHSPYAFVRQGDPDLFEGIPDVPVRITGPVARLEGVTGEVLAAVQLPEAPPTVNTTLLWHEPAGDEDQSYPYLLRTYHGKGLCLYAASALATSLTTFDGIGGGWGKELLLRLLRLLLPEQERCVSINAPPACEVVLNRASDRLVLNLINHYAGHPDYLPTGSNEVRLGPFDLTLRAGIAGPVVAQVQPDGDQLPTITEGDALRLTAPPFDVHQVISITPRNR